MYKIRKKNLDIIGNFGITQNSFSKLKEEKMKENLGVRQKELWHIILVLVSDSETWFLLYTNYQNLYMDR